MKKIIAVLLSIMLAFGVATSAFAVADTTDTTSVSISEAETPSDAPATDTDAPATDTDAPSTETDAPTEDEEPSFLDRIDSAILNFIKDIVKILGDAWDSLVAFLDQYN
jgi:hypothetical protein